MSDQSPLCATPAVTGRREIGAASLGPGSSGGSVHDGGGGSGANDWEIARIAPKAPWTGARTNAPNIPVTTTSGNCASWHGSPAHILRCRDMPHRGCGNRRRRRGSHVYDRRLHGRCMQRKDRRPRAPERRQHFHWRRSTHRWPGQQTHAHFISLYEHLPE